MKASHRRLNKIFESKFLSPRTLDSSSPHIPVLTSQILEIFHEFPPNKSCKKDIFIDCTLGFGYHARELFSCFPYIHIHGIDKDKEARSFALSSLRDYKDRLSIHGGPFSEIFPKLLSLYKHRIFGVLADIGVSSYQLDNPQRGFGFNAQKMDMRMDLDSELTAESILLSYNYEQLWMIFYQYGELREAKALASGIFLLREKNPQILTTPVLFSQWLLKNFKNPKILPLVFQALRCEVNQELKELQSLLTYARELRECTLCIISFHSLEDRLVKDAFKNYASSCICPKTVLRCECGNNHALGYTLTKKPQTASESERKSNPRSRSAKLRAFRFYEQKSS